MARPQLKLPGTWANVCNFLLAELAAREITGLELRVLLLIMRDTYGWEDKASKAVPKRRLDRRQISIKSLVERTGASDRGVREAMHKLTETMGIVHVYASPSGKSPGIYGIISDVSLWKVKPVGAVAEMDSWASLTGARVPVKRPPLPEPECRSNDIDRNQSADQSGTRVPVTPEPECRSTNAETKESQALDGGAKRKKEKEISLKESEESEFFWITSSEEAKARDDLSLHEARGHMEHYLLSTWSEVEFDEDESKELAGYLRGTLPPNLLLANLITGTDNQVDLGRVSRSKGFHPDGEPILKSIRNAKALKAQRLGAHKAAQGVAS